MKQDGVRCGMDLRGKAGVASSGMALCGAAWRCTARLGSVWIGEVRQAW